MRGVLAQRTVVDPEGESANLGAGPAMSPDADFETENGICRRAPEWKPVRAQSWRGRVAGERGFVAHGKPHFGTGMKRRQFEYTNCLESQSCVVISNLANLQGKVAFTRQDDKILGYKGNGREVGAVPDMSNLL